MRRLVTPLLAALGLAGGAGTVATAGECFDISPATTFCAPDVLEFQRGADNTLRGSYVGTLANVTIMFMPGATDPSAFKFAYQKTGFFDRAPRIVSGTAQVGPHTAVTQSIETRSKGVAPMLSTIWSDQHGVIVVVTGTSQDRLSRVISLVNDATLDGFKTNEGAGR